MPAPFGHSRARNLALAGLAFAALAWLVLVDLQLWFFRFPSAPDPADFSLYFGAARIGLEHGWSRIYDAVLQRQAFYTIHPAQDRFDVQTLYVTPPPMAWLVAPLALLPYALAFYLWVALCALGYLVVGLITTPGDRLARAAVVLAGATTYPFLAALQNGQVALPIALGAGAAALCLERGRPLLAALALSPLILKPQVAFLAPVVFLAGGRGGVRALLAWLGIELLIAGASLVVLGAGGLHDYRRLLATEGGNVDNQIWTPAILVGLGWGAYAIEAAAGLVAVAAIGLAARRTPSLALATALVGSMVASPYHHGADSVVLLVALWLQLRSRVPRWHYPWLLFGLGAAFFGSPWGPRPLLAFALGWLFLMAVQAVRLSPGSSKRRLASC